MIVNNSILLPILKENRTKHTLHDLTVWMIQNFMFAIICLIIRFDQINKCEKFGLNRKLK